MSRTTCRTRTFPFGAGSHAEGGGSSPYGFVPPQPASSSFGPEQVLGDVLDEDEVGVLVLLGVEVGLGLLVPLELLDPLEPLEPLARATLTVVIAGTA